MRSCIVKLSTESEAFTASFWSLLVSCILLRSPHLPYDLSVLRHAISSIDPEIQDVTFSHHVFLTLKPEKAFLLASRDALILSKGIIGHCLCSNEALLKVAVNHSRSLWRKCALPDCPSSCLFFSCQIEMSESIERSDYWFGCSSSVLKMTDHLFCRF